MTLIGILWLLLFGLIVGVIAKWIVPGTAPGGIIGDIILGLVGAFIGGYIYNLFGHSAPGMAFSLPSILCGVIGAVVLLWLVRLLTGARAA
jgi:uncharacterized membrane protein YeaQ/YmgE (transglycosylase-associated protein family)